MGIISVEWGLCSATGSSPVIQVARPAMHRSYKKPMLLCWALHTAVLNCSFESVVMQETILCKSAPALCASWSGVLNARP